MATSFSTTFRAAAPGLSSLAASIGGGGNTYEAARDKEIQLQSKLAQQIAAQRASNATADMNTAKAEGERFQTAQQQPDMLRRNAMTINGIPLDEDSAVSSYFQTGKLGGKYTTPDDGMGPVAPQPEWLSKLGNVARAIGGVQTAITIGDKNSTNIAKAGQINREMSLGDAILAGTQDRNRVAGSQAAIEGKPIYHSDANGAVLDLFNGGLNESGGLAQSQIAFRKAQANNQNASAGQHSASTRKINQEIEFGGKGTLQQTDQGLLLVDPRTGQARAVVGPDGKPAGKPGAGGVKLTEDQGKATGWLIQANNAWKNMEAAALGPADAKGVRPIKSAAYPGVNDGIAALPGWATAGMGAPAANLMRGKDRQKFIQASSSLSEALLRAATGAGVNRDEAAQKIKELTPVFGESEETTRQKFDSIPLYIKSLQVRAGPGAAQAAAVAAGDAAGGWSITKE